MALTKATRTTQMLEKLLDGYDKRLRPNFGGSDCCYIFPSTLDRPRLAYGPSLGIHSMKLLGHIAQQVWLPDTYFLNDLSDKSTCGDFLFDLSHNGHITFSCRKKLRLYCPMNLRKFPMDEQVCEMAMESYSYTMEDLILSWLLDNKGSVRVSHDLQIPQYTLVDWEQTLRVEAYSTGNFSVLSAKFHLYRQLGYYILQEFVPTILIVAVSWVGFWIDERSVPARVSLGITTVLAITTLMFGVQSSLPRVGHVKAIDVFLLGSFLFVFAALVEFAVICSFSLYRINRIVAPKDKRFNSTVKSTFQELNDVETGCKENGVLQRAFETKQETIQVKDHHDENYNPSPGFTTAFPKSSSPSWFSETPRSWLANTVKLPKQVSRASTVQREPCAIDKHCRKLFPLAYVLFHFNLLCSLLPGRYLRYIVF
ncbi:hypothetical protein OS493_031291 [Desmophyllum pertusum]|uniref:Uncharacterized protein n=1 Tax=Desmophyllum pertusum TaxID=174260 RepID=A0A9W9ZAC3_9CNID|nr:hypothetical protein OS493_031291 [Desmophyllum pertusum]